MHCLWLQRACGLCFWLWHCETLLFPQPLQSGPLSMSSLLPARYLPLASLPVLLFPDPALCCWPKLARWGPVWIFSCLPDHTLCIVETCVGFPQPPEPALCVARLMCTSLGLTGLPSVPHNLCALQRLVCHPSLGMPACAARVAWAGVYMPPHSWHHRLQGFYGLLPIP